MSEQEQQPVDTGEQKVVVEPSAETKNPETTNSHMIPKARFDEVNSRLKQLLAEQEAATKQQQEAQEAQLLEQQKYQELYEAQKKRADEAAQRVAEIERQSLARDVATKAGIPQMWERLRGETQDELEADAKELLAMLPKPQAPNLDAGKNGKLSNAPTEAEIKEMAARLGVRADLLMKQYTG